MIDLICPHCGEEISAEDDWVGEEAECNECKGRFLVPEISQHLEASTGNPKKKIYLNKSSLSSRSVNRRVPASRKHYGNYRKQEPSRSNYVLVAGAAMFFLVVVSLLLIGASRNNETSAAGYPRKSIEDLDAFEVFREVTGQKSEREQIEQIKRDGAMLMKEIERDVALDSVEEYRIVSRNGSEMDAYVQAGFVAAAFLQANDERNYRKWKEVERKHAKRLGFTE